MDKEKNSFLDFDGVLLDSEKRIMELKSSMENISWDDFFELIDWEKLLDESKEINDSFAILKELQKMKKKYFILTKIHTLKEALAKVQYTRQRGVDIPIIIVPPHTKKSEIYVPSNNEILVDDSIKNVDDWENKGGYGVLFSEEFEKNEPKKVKDLTFLLK